MRSSSAPVRLRWLLGVTSSALLAFAGSAACEPPLAPPPDDGGTTPRDGGVLSAKAQWALDNDAGCTDQAPGLVSKSLLAESPTAYAYKVAYRVGGLRLLGQLCVPKSAGKHPILLYTHNDVLGMQGQWGLFTGQAPTLCGQFADEGYVVAQAQLRGQEDGLGKSEGRVELCAGEADDVLELMRIAGRRCDVDRSKVVAFGRGLGACATLRAAALGPRLTAVGAVVPFIDWLPSYARSVAAADAGDPGAAYALSLFNRYLGPPEPDAGAYLARDLLPLVPQLAGTPTMLVVADNDTQAPVQSACALRAALVDAGHVFTDFRLNPDGTPTVDADARCPGLALTSQPPPADAGSAFVLLKDQAHELGNGSASRVSHDALYDFLAAHLR